MNRATVREELRLGGVGVHSGLRCEARVCAAPWGTGRVFVREGEPIPADLAHARVAPGAVELRGEGTRVGTPEHLLAALSAFGLTDVRVEVEGPELPILDGSARPWCDGLVGVGLVEGPPLQPWRITEPVEVSARGGVARLLPGEGCQVAVEVDFGGPWRGAVAISVDPVSFTREVAWARTFAMARDLPALRAAGRGQGASAENTVLLGDEWALTSLRAPDEPVRHKLLDAIGDLALLGPVQGRMEVVRGSHALHLELLRRYWGRTRRV